MGRTRTCTIVVILVAIVCIAMAMPAFAGGSYKKVGDPSVTIDFSVMEWVSQGEGRNAQWALIPLKMPQPDGTLKEAGVWPAPKDSVIIARLRPLTLDRRLEWWEGRINGAIKAKSDALDALYTMEARDENGNPLWDTKKYGTIPFSQTDMDPYKFIIDTHTLTSGVRYEVEALTRSTNGLAGFGVGQFKVSDRTIAEWREEAERYFAQTQGPQIISRTTRVERYDTKPQLPADIPTVAPLRTSATSGQTDPETLPLAPSGQTLMFTYSGSIGDELVACDTYPHPVAVVEVYQFDGSTAYSWVRRGSITVDVSLYPYKKGGAQ